MYLSHYNDVIEKLVYTHVIARSPNNYRDDKAIIDIQSRHTNQVLLRALQQ